MAMKWREKVLLANVESTYGVDPILTGASNAIMAKDIEMSPLETEAIQRGIERPYLGAEEDVFVSEHVAISFKVELTASGTLGVAPSWGVLLRACGFAEVITVDEKVEYILAGDDYESIAMKFFLGENLHPLLGARGDWKITLEKGIPYLEFDFKGLWTPPTNDALPTVDFSAWKKPTPLGPGHTTNFALHGFAGIPSKLNIAGGNEVLFDENLITQKIELTDRACSGSVTIESPTIAQINFFTRTLGSEHGPLTIANGAVGGDRITISCPNVQVKTPKYNESNKKVALEMGLGLLPVLGNDEIKITID